MSQNKAGSGLDPALLEKNWYEVLELEPAATVEAIKKAVRQQSLLYHPDKSSAADAPAKFLLVQKAKEVLLDEEKKTAFDKHLEGQLRRQNYNDERTKTMDDRRKRMKQELESKMKDLAGKKTSAPPAESKPQHQQQQQQPHQQQQQNQYSKADLDKFRQDAERLREEALNSAAAARRAAAQPTEVKVKWNKHLPSHSDDSLYRLFKVYGEVESTRLAGDKGNCGIVVFRERQAAISALNAFENNKDYRLSIVSDPKPAATPSIFTHKYASSSSTAGESGKTAESGPSSGLSQSRMSDEERNRQREMLLRAMEEEEGGAASASNFNTSSSSSSSRAPSAFSSQSSVGEGYEPLPPGSSLMGQELEVLAKVRAVAARKRSAQLAGL